MAHPKENEIQMIEVKGSLSVPQIRRPAPPKRNRPAPTPAGALEALRSMNGAASVMERIPGLRNTDAWVEVAWWGPYGTRGSALYSSGPFIWDCDFGAEFSMDYAYLNPSLEFRGADPIPWPGVPSVTPPPSDVTGRIWCHWNAPSDGYYVFAAQLTPGGEFDEVSYVQCGIDDVPFHITKVLDMGQQPFVANLTAGIHKFYINQTQGTLVFYGLTAWQVSPLVQNPVPEQTF